MPGGIVKKLKSVNMISSIISRKTSHIYFPCTTSVSPTTQEQIIHMYKKRKTTLVKLQEKIQIGGGWGWRPSVYRWAGLIAVSGPACMKTFPAT